jgi:hypothetical protein
MTSIIGMALMAAVPVLTVVLVVGVVALVGLIAYDVISEDRNGRVRARAARVRTAEDAETRIYLERGVARAFVILGGTFWGIAAFAGLYSFGHTGMASALLGAFVPLLATLVTLVVGWYWERIASMMLAVATGAVVYWGLASQFEAGVWLIMLFALIGPMLTASVLFWLARRDQEALELFLLTNPELAPTVARS